MKEKTVTEHSTFRNWAAVIVLALVYIIPALFVSPQHMLDILSIPMLVSGGYGICLIASETWKAFKSGDQSRSALGLFGIFALLTSVVIMRPYGISSRNIEGADAWLETTHIFPIALYLQAIGLALFSRASAAPMVPTKGRGVGQIVAGVVIGVLIASSKALDPILMFVSKLFTGLVR